MAFTCPLCGTENEDGLDRCASCGARLTPAVPQPGTPAEQQEASPGPAADTTTEMKLRDPVDDPWFAEDIPPGVAVAGAAGEPPVETPAHEDAADPADAPQDPPSSPGDKPEDEAADSGSEQPHPGWQQAYAGQPAPYPYPWNPWMYGGAGVPPYMPPPFPAPYPGYPGYPPLQPPYGFPYPCPWMAWYGHGGPPYGAYPAPYAPAGFQAPAYGAPYPDPYQGYSQRPAPRSRKKVSAGLVIGIIIVLLAIAGGVTAAVLLTSGGKASFNLGDGAVTGADIEFKGVKLEQDGNSLTLSGTYDNNSKREGTVTATVQALTGASEQLIAFEVPVEPGTGTQFSKQKSESIKINGATLGPLLFSSSGSYYNDTGNDYEDGSRTTTPGTTPKSTTDDEEDDSTGTTPGSNGTTYPGYPGYPGTYPGYPYDDA